MIWRVTDEFYWGGMNTPSELNKYNIQSLICVAEELPMPVINIPFVKLPVPNGHPVPPQTQEIFLTIAKSLITNYKPLAVYCQQGQNRSAGLVFLWLVKVCGKTQEEAWNIMKSIKPDVLTWSQNFNEIKELQ